MAIELISRISKGSRMDQIYISKNRSGFAVGNYVVITALEGSESGEGAAKKASKPYFYGIKQIEPIKLSIIEEIFRIVDKNHPENKNIIITGSFLEKGFEFNDIDIILLSDKKAETEDLKEKIEEYLGINAHILLLDEGSLREGIASDPLYENMLSRCISKNRFVFNIARKINPQILDFHLLKSKALIDGFDILVGKEKYYLVKNMISILLFIKGEKINNEKIDSKIKEIFGISSEKIKDNILDKRDFLRKYKKAYELVFRRIMKEIKNQEKHEPE